jgi:hypothetical protein
MSSAESNLHELYATSHVAENKVIKIRKDIDVNEHFYTH